MSRVQLQPLALQILRLHSQGVLEEADLSALLHPIQETLEALHHVPDDFRMQAVLTKHLQNITADSQSELKQEFKQRISVKTKQSMNLGLVEEDGSGI